MGLFKKIKQRIKRTPKDDILETIKEARKDSSIEKYDKGLKKSRVSFISKVKNLFVKYSEINDDFFNDLAEILIMADVGADQTHKLIKDLKKYIQKKKITNIDDMKELIFSFLFERYIDNDNGVEKLNLNPENLNVIIVMGVNGVGKTTTIGKLVHYLKRRDFRITLGAGDTFRAGAVEQLKIWAQRNDVDIVSPKKEGQDPSSIVYESIASANDKNHNVVIIDTAGRLQNKKNLMMELEKMNKVIAKTTGEKASETLLILDATTGQNGIEQANAFNEVAELTGLILTKMDSSSKGGIILAIKDNFNVPVKFIGIGEQIDDLEEFDISKYLHSLLKDFIDEEEDI